MKLICTQSDLSNHLSLVGRAVPARPQMPVLSNILLVADAELQTISLTAFDMSLGIRTSFAAQVLIPGQLTLPARLFNDIVSRLPEGEITIDDGRAAPSPDDFEAASEGVQAVLKSRSGEYKLRGSLEMFPELPIVTSGKIAHLPVNTLIEGFQGSLFATSSDESKQVLTGVHVTLHKDTLEFAATDGHRLSVVQTSSPEVGEGEESSQAQGLDASEFEVTIPGKTLRELERVLAMRQTAESVAIHFDAAQVVFEWADQRLTSRLLEGSYPNYRQLIPRQFARQMTVDRRLCLSALERIAVLTDQQRNNVVKLSLNAETQRIALSVDAQDVGQGKEDLDAQISGESLEIAFNVKYLMDGLKALPTPEIQMQMNGATQPVILTPVGGAQMTYLIMPVQVRS